MCIIEFLKNKIRYENIILFICILILAVHFYPTAGRFLDLDEEFFFSATSAFSEGAGLYTDLNFYYPPISLYIGAIFFKIFPNLYQTMLAIRIFIITLSLIGFYLIFDMFKKMKLSWFIIPITIFIFFSMQFDLKLMEYRADNILFFVIVLQGYFIFLLSCDRARNIKRFFLSEIKIALVILLCFIAFHINQKALLIEPFLMLAFLLCCFKEIQQFVLKRKKILIISTFLLAIYFIFSKSYHQFFYQCYIYAYMLFKKVPFLFPEFSHTDKSNFIIQYIKHNITFWLLLPVLFISFLGYLKKDKRYLVPLAFLIGGSFVVVGGFFPFVHYHLYLVWGILFSMPYFINLCCKRFPQKRIFIFLIIFLLSLSSIFTFQHYSWPYKSLKAYASMIEEVQEVVGDKGIASFNGALINIPTDLPFCDNTLQFRGDEQICQSKNIKNVFKNKKTKFIFIDQRETVKKILTNKDGYFIKSNYQECFHLPLMISSKWIYLKLGRQTINFSIHGEYKVFLFTNEENQVFFNKTSLSDYQILNLSGDYVLETEKPAVLLIEYNTNKINSKSLASLNISNLTFIPLNQVFADKFKLLGLVHYQKDDQFFYRLFWEVLSDINNELRAFHHFRDKEESYLSGINVDPSNGWYDINDLGQGEIITYQFSVEKSDKYKSLDIGWYFEENQSKRLKYNNSSFYRFFGKVE